MMVRVFLQFKTAHGLFKAGCSAAILLLVFLSSSVFAVGDLPGRLLGEVESRAVIEVLSTQHAGIETLSAVTLQRRTSPLLAEEIVTEGVIVLKKPNLLRWDIEQPSRLVIAVDGTAMWIYHPDKKEAEKRVLSDDVVARYAMEFFSSTMNLSIERLSKRFFVEIYKGEGGESKTGSSIILKLRPRSKMAARHLDSIAIWYREKDGSPERMTLRSRNKAVTTTEFKEVELNVAVGAEKFALALPGDVLITGLMEEDEDF